MPVAKDKLKCASVFGKKRIMIVLQTWVHKTKKKVLCI